MTPTRVASEGGFALLVLFAVIASASIGIVLAVQALAPLADSAVRAQDNLAAVEIIARDEFRRRGAFPATLGGLVAASDGLTTAPWRTDPWGAARDLDYRLVGASLRVRSRGVDGVLGTSDDLQADVLAESLVRVRQRARLRIVRAVMARSQYRHAPSMTASDEATMVAAMRDYAIAKRGWLTADAATRSALTTQMNTAESTITSMASSHGCTPMPSAVLGAGGLMEGLGLPPEKAMDGIGAYFVIDTAVGVTARGSDLTVGTDDDM